jgi:hypothetical protein
VLLPLLDILQSVPVLGYAELFEYDAKTQQFCVEREAEQGAA